MNRSPIARPAVYRVTRVADVPRPPASVPGRVDAEERTALDPVVDRVARLRLELGIEVEEVVVDGYGPGRVRAVRLVKVRPGSSARAAGLEAGDVVVRLDEKPEAAGFVETGGDARPVERVRLAVIRSRTGRLETSPAIRLTGLAQAPMAPSKAIPRGPSKDMPTASAAPTFPGTGADAETPSIPSFPWPPPQYSASTVIPDNLVHQPGADESLLDVSRRLEAAFQRAGYGQISYYAIPKGFAMATRLEQFADDGTPLPVPQRWSADVAPPKVFSLGSYLRALYGANPGHFRVILLAVTSESVVPGAKAKITREEASLWPTQGATRLPASYRNMPYVDGDYACSALIYEFQQGGPDDAPLLKTPGLDAQVQLEKANILKGIVP